MIDVTQNKAYGARKRSEAMVVRESKNDQLYIAFAERQARTGALPRDVAATLQPAAQVDPQRPGARVALMRYSLWSGDSKPALTAAQTAMTRIRSDPLMRATAPTEQEAAGEINHAVGTYTKVAGVLPKSRMPLYRRAALRQRQNEMEGAIETPRQMEKHLLDDGRQVGAQAIQTFAATCPYDDTCRGARERQKSAPDFARGWVLDGDNHSSQCTLADAEQRLYCDALERELEAYMVAVTLHGALSAIDRSDQVDAWAKNSIAADSTHTVLRVYLAGRQLEANGLKEAAGQYHTARGIDPDSMPALNNLAWNSGEFGDPKALGYVEREVKLVRTVARLSMRMACCCLRTARPTGSCRSLHRRKGVHPRAATAPELRKGADQAGQEG